LQIRFDACMLQRSMRTFNTIRAQSMKYLPIYTSSFEPLISNNYIYVDKTKDIYRLFSEGNKHYYFLSRPRRFGKTLLISTLKELFLGKRELFKGLWIDSSDWQWEKHPVIHLDFGAIAHNTVEQLTSSFSWNLTTIARNYEIDVSQAPTPQDKFKELVVQLAKKHTVVVLIDEYDKPILDHLKDIEQAKAQRDALKSFYDVLKGLDEYLRAIFITGVTKFAKTSLFSGLNNLNDITIKPEVATLLGYTQEEITKYFADYIASLAHQNQTTFETILDEMKTWYNGYQFSKQAIKVYNPFSVLYCLKDKDFANYWYESGTPTFLITMVQAQYQNLEEIKELEIDADSLGTFNIESIPLVPLLFQAGYLTFSSYNEGTKKFKLGYPNQEVALSFKRFLVASLAYTDRITVDTNLSKLAAALKQQDLELFCKILQALFAHIPYNLHIDKESYYHSLFQFLMSLLALEAHSEVITNQGRIDTVIAINDLLYIFELKINKPTIEALEQIKERKYYERYALHHKNILLIGLVFNTKEAFSVEYVMQKG
jgi:predicted AAA-ATPase/PD-(D/E)XK nuclease superfamily protein